MKYLLILITLLSSFAAQLSATTPTLESITQPLYYLGAANQDKGVPQYIKVPRVLNHAFPPLMACQYASPTYASGDLSENNEDLNLASVYGLKVSARVLSDEQTTTGRQLTIEFTVDIRNANKPDHFPLSIEEVGNFTAKAIRIDYPDTDRFVISILSDDGKVKL